MGGGGGNQVGVGVGVGVVAWAFNEPTTKNYNQEMVPMLPRY